MKRFELIFAFIACTMIGVMIGSLAWMPHVRKLNSQIRMLNKPLRKFTPPSNKPEVSPDEVTATICVSSKTITCIDPILSGYSIAAAILLSHQLETDSLVINGYDQLFIDQEIMNTLHRKGIFSDDDIEKIIKKSKISPTYRVETRR